MATNVFNDYLDVPVEDLVEKPSGIVVPNKQPSLNLPYRIAIVGEAPGRDEELQGQPFVGMSGKLLTGLLSKAGIVREACFIGNVCQQRPPENKIENFSREGPEVVGGLSQLAHDLTEFNPNICLLLGKTALWAADGKGNVSDYRGSLFVSNVVGPFLGRKCIASYHPAAILRQYDWIAYLWFDILKTYREASTPSLALPERNLEINLTAIDIVNALARLQANKALISVDIEGYWNDLKCCSFADAANHSFIVPFQNLDGSSYWSSEDDELAVWKAFVDVLCDPAVPKVFQNGLYDRFCLQYGYQIPVRGNVDDTMLKWWEKFCELEKGLGVQASILTNEPHYKFERKSTTKEDFYRYCCKDSAVTYEINDKLTAKLDAAQLAHYRFNISLLNPILYMELRGIKYDKALAEKRLKEVNQHIYTYQAQLDSLANVGITPFDDKESLKAKVREAMCYKCNPEVPKKEYASDYYSVRLILKDPAPLTPQQIGFINIACGWSMNVKGKGYKTFLYETLKLPKQYNTDKFGKKALSTDNDALLTLQKKGNIPAVELGINIMELRTRSQMLEIKSDPDGRIRCGYNLVGTVTGRISCYTSPTGSGYNMQTIPDSYTALPEGHPLRTGMRDLFIADLGYSMFQCDLKGSDGWTIGAWLYRLGDPSMLNDLRNGIKPAARICYMLRHGNHTLIGKSVDETKDLLKEIKKEDCDYFAMKIGIWGQCYLMGPDLLNAEILSESYGRMSLSRSEIKDFQNATFTAYDVRRWHRFMENHLAKNPTLFTIDGHTRKFWSRPQDRLGKALAHEPQMVTTHATKLALLKMWNDPVNRVGNQLKAEPLHTVHDSLVGQTKKERSWLEEQLVRWFDNEITVAGMKIKIPYSFEWGTNWSFK